MQTVDTHTSKGRNPCLIANRNKKLAARFYWYSSVVGLKFSRCLKHLAEEFDLSESRLCDLISENAELITLLEHRGVTISDLKTQFPYLTWQHPSAKQFRIGTLPF